MKMYVIYLLLAGTLGLISLQTCDATESTEYSFTEDFGILEKWVRNGWNDWYCPSSAVTGIYGHKTYNTSFPGMSGYHAECAYKGAYNTPDGRRYFSDDIPTDQEKWSYVWLEATMHQIGNVYGCTLYLGANATNVNGGGGWTYVDLDFSNDSYGVRFKWFSYATGKTAAQPIVTFGSDVIAISPSVDDLLYIDTTYRIRLGFDFVNDKMRLDYSTYNESLSTWGAYEEIFDWTDAGVDLSQAGINVMGFKAGCLNTSSYTAIDDFSSVVVVPVYGTLIFIR